MQTSGILFIIIVDIYFIFIVVKIMIRNIMMILFSIFVLFDWFNVYIFK